MKRPGIAISTAVILLAVALFVVLVWINWREPRLRVEDGVTYLLIGIGGGKAVPAEMWQLMTGLFGFGLLVGLLATLTAFWANRSTLRAELDSLRADKRRLAAANRALEAALPVLRERYDAAIGGLDPSANALNEPVGDESETVSVKQLALEDAAARQAERRQAVRGDR